MRKVIVFSLLMLLTSMTIYVSAARRVPQTINKWKDGNDINWDKICVADRGPVGEDWRDKFPAVAEKADEATANKVWSRVSTAKAMFHQENLWMLTVGNDSLAAAMIDVEWAFDGLFLMYFGPMPRRGLRTLSVGGGGIDEILFAETYNQIVGKRINAILEIKGWDYDEESENVRFARTISKWTMYRSVGWSGKDTLVGNCPDSYLKRMAKGHTRAEVRAEWNRVQNTIHDFHEVTQWVRDKGNKKMNKSLDDFEESLMSYFRKYVRTFYAVGMNMQVYSEIVPMAVDVLCMEYVSALREAEK